MPSSYLVTLKFTFAAMVAACRSSSDLDGGVGLGDSCGGSSYSRIFKLEIGSLVKRM